MLNKEELEKEAFVFLSDQLDLPAEAIDGGMELKSMGMDSFRIIEFVLFLERKTGITLPDHSYTPANLKSLDSIVHCFMTMQR